jgi:hypothetical protein
MTLMILNGKSEETGVEEIAVVLHPGFRLRTSKGNQPKLQETTRD